MNPAIPTIEWATLWPIIIVTCTGIIALLIEMFRPKQNNNAIVLVSLAGLGLAAYSVLPQFNLVAGSTFSGMITRDVMGLVMQLLLIGICFVAFLFSEGYLREKRIAFGEFYPLALWSTVGGMIMVSTTNMLMQFIGLEVLSIALYCLAGMSRQESRSEESAIKYFLLGAFASSFLLYGIAFVYGASGSLDFSGITIALESGDDNLSNMALLGIGLMLVGFGFKTALVPFHQWTPDVYQGAPTNVTGFMAAASKVAAFGALIRLLTAAVPMQEYWFPVLFWVAILTMTVGNLVALTQKDVKRALGYSSIANAGYILVALLAHYKSPDSVSLNTTIFYLVSYSVMTLGAFAVITLTAEKGKEGTRFQDLNGLWKKSPYAAGALVIFCASLVGVPPTAGFFGKWFIFADALKADLLPLAIVLAVNSAVSAYYYLGIVRSAFVDDEPAVRAPQGQTNFGLSLACTTCVVAILYLTVNASGAMRFVGGEGTEVAKPPAPPAELAGAAGQGGGEPPIPNSRAGQPESSDEVPAEDGPVDTRPIEVVPTPGEAAPPLDEPVATPR